MDKDTNQPTIPGQSIYLPANGLERATHQHSYGRLAVVESSAPDQICGQAIRIGYMSHESDALALYRIKIRYNLQTAPSRAFMTLAGIFVLEHYVFSLLSLEDAGG